MMRLYLIGLATLATALPTLAADSTKMMSPASRVVAVGDQPMLNRTTSLARPALVDETTTGSVVDGEHADQANALR